MSTNKNAKTPNADIDIIAHNEAINAALAAMPPMPGGARKAKAVRACECGCEGLTKSRFVPGHDARLAGWVKRIERGLLVHDGDMLAQIDWIAKHASPGQAVAARRVIEAKYGSIEPQDEAEATA